LEHHVSGSWTNEKKEALERFEVDLAEVKGNTSMLPYKIALQAKMIALWIESITGEVIDVVIDYERHADE
jgi:predicted small secreted protein